MSGVGWAPYVCRASGSASSGRAACCGQRETCWCYSPECCSDASDSPGRRLGQSCSCPGTCRPCSACPCWAESRWRDGRIARGHIWMSAQSLWKRTRWFNFDNWIFKLSFKHILRMKQLFFITTARIIGAWMSLSPKTARFPISLVLRIASRCVWSSCSEGLFSHGWTVWRKARVGN